MLSMHLAGKLENSLPPGVLSLVSKEFPNVEKKNPDVNSRSKTGPSSPLAIFRVISFIKLQFLKLCFFAIQCFQSFSYSKFGRYLHNAHPTKYLLEATLVFLINVLD